MRLLLPHVLEWSAPFPKVADGILMNNLGKEVVRKVFAVLSYETIFPRFLSAVESHHFSHGNIMNRRAAPRSVFLIKKTTLHEFNSLMRPLQNGDNPTVQLQLYGKVGPHTFNCSVGWLPCQEIGSAEESSHDWLANEIGGGDEKSDADYTRVEWHVLEKLVNVAFGRMASLPRNSKPL
jgi:hypothetical protein